MKILNEFFLYLRQINAYWLFISPAVETLEIYSVIGNQSGYSLILMSNF
jgi:hypothetical protein